MKGSSEVYNISTSQNNWLEELETDMTGPFQSKNIGTVIEAIYRWNEFYPEFVIHDAHIRKGLQDVRVTTNMIGRWMIMSQHPMVITDAAHNLDGMSSIIPALLNMTSAERHFVLGFVSDKDVSKILTLFPQNGKYYWCSPAIPRGKPADETRESGLIHGLKGTAFPSVRLAYDAAISNAFPADLVFVGGSSYVVGDFLASLQMEKRKA